ncbi:MAG: ankyrin repeat domain-containing protein [Candidatus ainarchaeum sp.]|nr:ankyrin repeat domain-containing protein [Candidatus ainarchaeum sp.]
MRENLARRLFDASLGGQVESIREVSAAFPSLSKIKKALSEGSLVNARGIKLFFYKRELDKLDPLGLVCKSVKLDSGLKHNYYRVVLEDGTYILFNPAIGQNKPLIVEKDLAVFMEEMAALHSVTSAESGKLEMLGTRINEVEIADMRGDSYTVACLRSSKGRVFLLSSMRVEGLEELIERGAPVDWRNFWEQTPLMVTTSLKHHEAMSFLLGKGADPNLKDLEKMGARTPLMLATLNGDSKGVGIILDDPRTNWLEKDADGRNALMLAVLNRRIEIVRLLLKDSRADIGAVDYEGDSVHELARRYAPTTPIPKMLARKVAVI